MAGVGWWRGSRQLPAPHNDRLLQREHVGACASNGQDVMSTSASSFEEIQKSIPTNDSILLDILII